jgi:predicted alpha/beta superfamily hydrolase
MDHHMLPPQVDASLGARSHIPAVVRARRVICSLAAGVLLLSTRAGVAEAQRAPAGTPAPETPPPVTLPATHIRVLRSAVNGREYHIAVALPMNYDMARGANTTRYPVLYVLDGGAHLPLLASMFRLSNRGGKTGDVILVGIGYYPPGAFPRPVPGQVPARNVDYSPPPFRSAGTQRADGSAPPWPAGAPAFHQVLRDEIIPWVERTYRTTTDRGLHGHSLGGLFATYVLFEDPDLFSRYAIMSPSYWWDSESMYAREAEFRTRRTSLPKQVFIGVGGLEGPAIVGGMWRMVSALCVGLKAGSYQGLSLAAEVIPDEHHGSAVLFGRPLRAFYPPYETGTASQDICAGR